MVHVRFNPHSVRLDTHFEQIGFGHGPYFEGLPYQRGYGYQRGLGIGSLYSSLLRYVLPLVSSAKKGLTRMAKSGAKTVGKVALITGARILDDVAQGTNLKDAVVTETKEGAKRVKQKIFRQKGSGAMKRKRSKTRKSKKKTKKRKKKAAKKRKRIVGAKVLKTKAIKRRRRDVLGFY